MGCIENTLSPYYKIIKRLLILYCVFNTEGEKNWDTLRNKTTELFKKRGERDKERMIKREREQLISSKKLC